MPKLMHFFSNFDMRNSHDGIMLFLKKKKIEVTEDDFIVFMNGRRTMIKMVCRDNKCLLHYKSRTSIDPQLIKHLPKYVGGKTMGIDEAIKDNIEEMMKRRTKT